MGRNGLDSCGFMYRPVADPFKGGNERWISQIANSMRLRFWFSWKDFLCAFLLCG